MIGIAGLCPEGQGVFVDERSQKPLTSNGNSNECPLGFFGVFNDERKKFFCCSPNDYKKLQCPNGLDPSKNLNTQALMGCNYDSQCLPGARCTANGERTGICCNRGPPCPPTFSLDVERSRKPCDPLKSPTCGDSLSVCLHSEILERFVCCKRGARPHQELTRMPR
ncbi:Arginine kinase [Aphelenchoides fujianensis]|nr:Arginine kinase [Aphelenchoides fujianensis]